MSALGKLVVSIALEHADFTKGLNKSEQEAQRFAKNTQGNFSSLDKVTSQVFGSMAKAVVGPIAAFASVSAAIDLVSNSLNFADKINDVSKANEVAVGTVLNLSKALSLNGGEADNAGKVFASLTAKLDEAAGGSESAQAQFKKIGISLKDLATLDGEALFEKTLAGLMAIEDPIKRNALAMDLLGKSVKAVDIKGLGANFSDNKQNFEDAGEKFRAIGEAMDKIDTVSIELKTSLATLFGPIVLDGVKSFAGWIDAINFTMENGTGFEKFRMLALGNMSERLGDLSKKYPNRGNLQTDGGKIKNATLPTLDKPLREVIDTAAENAKKKALANTESLAKEAAAKAKAAASLANTESLAKEAAAKAKAAREKLNAEILKDIQNEINFQMDMDEAAYAAKQKAEKELYENKIKYLDLIQEQSDKAFQEELDRQKALQEQAAEFWGSIENTAHDVWTKVWLDGSNAFKNIGKTIKSSILDMLYQMTIKKWVLNIGMSATGMAASSAFAGVGELGTASGGNIFSSVSSLGKGLFDGLSGIQGSITSGIESLGTMLATGNGGLLDSLGGFLGANAGTIGNALPFAGAALQALTGNIKGAAFTAAGAALGSVIPGLGTALGGMLGSLVGSLFGGGAKRFESGTTGAYVGGTFNSTNINYKRGLGGEGSLSGLSEVFSKSLGSILSSFGLSDSISTKAVLGKKKKAWGVFDASFDGGTANYTKLTGKGGDPAQVLKDMVEAVLSTTLVQAIQSSKLSTSIKELFDGLTDKTQVSNMITASINLSNASDKLASSFGLTVDQAAQAALATGQMGDALASFLTGIATAAGGKSAAQLLVQARTSLLSTVSGDLPDTLKGFDSLIKGVDKSNAAGINEVAKMLSVRAGFEQYVTAIDSLKSGVNNAGFDFRTGSQKQVIMQTELANMFSELNLTVPNSIEELLALGDSIDYTTENGLNLAMAFPSLVNAFKLTQEQVTGLTDSLATLSTDGFATLLDYTRYKGVAANYGTQFAGDYTYNLKNGAIKQNPNSTTTVVGSDGKTNVVDEIKAMRNDLNTAMVAVATSSAQTAKVLRLWNGDGMPNVRVL